MSTRTGNKPLAEQECTPCQGDAQPLRGEELRDLHGQLDNGWEVVNEHHLEQEFSFDDFRQALDFTNRLGTLAEEQNHHPDIELGYGRVKITLFTHTIDGLSDADFVMAAKIDAMKR